MFIGETITVRRWLTCIFAWYPRSGNAWSTRIRGGFTWPSLLPHPSKIAERLLAVLRNWKNEEDASMYCRRSEHQVDSPFLRGFGLCFLKFGLDCYGQNGSGMFRRFSPPGHAWLSTDRDSRQNKNSAGLLCFRGFDAHWRDDYGVDYLAFLHGIPRVMEHPDPWRFQLTQIAEQYGPIASKWIRMFPHSSKTTERLKKIPGFTKPETECTFFTHMKQWRSHCFMWVKNVHSISGFVKPAIFFESQKCHGQFDICARDINASWLSASMATLHLNSTPCHLHGSRKITQVSALDVGKPSKNMEKPYHCSCFLHVAHTLRIQQAICQWHRAYDSGLDLKRVSRFHKYRCIW